MKRPLSMTSFGRGEAVSGNTTWTTEIRSVNHRYCDMNIKIPRRYTILEEKIKKELLTFFTRGRIDVMITYSGEDADITPLKANLPLAGEYYRCLKQVQEEFNLDSGPDLTMFSTIKDLITPMDQEEDLDLVWKSIRTSLVDATTGSLLMRQNEGTALKKELLGMLDVIRKTVDEIETCVPSIIEKKEKLLKERLDNLLQGVDIDPVRLAQEAAIITDKTDITEELQRLRSHINQFADFMDLDEPIGRRLDFLLQEFFREINTIASKISDASVAHMTVGLKNEVEKMREQVQNLE